MNILDYSLELHCRDENFKRAVQNNAQKMPIDVTSMTVLIVSLFYYFSFHSTHMCYVYYL